MHSREEEGDLGGSEDGVTNDNSRGPEDDATSEKDLSGSRDDLGGTEDGGSDLDGSGIDKI